MNQQQTAGKEKEAQSSKQQEPGRTPGSAEGDRGTVDKALKKDQNDKK